MDAGQSQLFNSNVTGGTPPYSYQWYLNGALVSGATNPTWTFTPTSVGSYTIYAKVIDRLGMQATSNTATVAVLIHDVAITDVRSSKTVVGRGYSVKINVTAANQGNYTETFNVTAYANTTIVGTLFTNITLTSGRSTAITFTWNTTGDPYGSYTIKVQVALAPSETNTANNTFVYGIIKVTIPGDIDGEGYVGPRNLGILGANYGSYAGYPNYNPNADITGAGYVGSRDLGILGANYGKYV
jgi:hypothetical protein